MLSNGVLSHNSDKDFSYILMGTRADCWSEIRGTLYGVLLALVERCSRVVHVKIEQKGNSSMSEFCVGLLLSIRHVQRGRGKRV